MTSIATVAGAVPLITTGGAGGAARAAIGVVIVCGRVDRDPHHPVPHPDPLPPAGGAPGHRARLRASSKISWARTQPAE